MAEAYVNSLYGDEIRPDPGTRDKRKRYEEGKYALSRYQEVGIKVKDLEIFLQAGINVCTLQ